MNQSAQPLKTAVVIFEDVKRDQARVYRALITAQELVESGDDVTIVFDGKGTETLAALSDSSNPMHALLEGLRSRVRGACDVCAKSHRVRDQLVQAQWPLLSEHKGHASLPALQREGYTVLNF